MKRASEAVIIDAIRTPIGKYGGALKDARPDDMSALILRTLIARSQLNPSLVEDVYWGCANQSGEDNRNVGRMALLLAGFPFSVPASTINRLCGSSMDALHQAARAIWCGAIALGHPLGCSGAHIVTSLVHEMKRRGAQRGIATMCIGVGQGITTIIEQV